MDTSILGIVIDSSVAIEAERQHLSVPQFLKRVSQEISNVQVALSAFTIAELTHGVYRTDNAERRERRRMFLDDLVASVPVHPFTQGTAELFGKISAESAARCVNVPVDDLIIATCALERVYAILTRNTRHFEKVPGLRLVRF